MRSPRRPPGGRARDFEQFWHAYPKKVGREAARKAFERTDVPLDTILEALEQQRCDPLWRKENGRFIPNPVTWLNQGRWADEPVDTSEFRSHGAPMSPMMQAAVRRIMEGVESN